MNEEDKRPEQIERDIEQTRAEVSATIDAIQSKLTPGQMMDQAISYLRTSLPADFGRNLADSARNNPMPVALIGIGIAWMALSGRQGSMGYASRRTEVDMPEFEGLDSERGGPSMTERAREASSQARERIGQTVQGARDTAHRVTDRSRRTYQQARSTVSHMVEEQPLVIGALGLAVGAALGAAMPRTEQEDEWMGESRDSLMRRATDSAHDYAERATDSARDAMHGLSEKVAASSDRPPRSEPVHAAASAGGDADRPSGQASSLETNRRPSVLTTGGTDRPPTRRPG